MKSRWPQLWIKHVDVVLGPQKSNCDASNASNADSITKRKYNGTSQRTSIVKQPKTVCHWRYNKHIVTRIFDFLGEKNKYTQGIALALVCRDWYICVKHHAGFWSSLDVDHFSMLCTDVQDTLVNTLVHRYRSVIKSVKIRDCLHVTEQSVFGIAYLCPNLVSLDLEGVGSYGLRDLTTSVVEISQRCKSLRHLNISWCFNISDAAIISISRNCKQLRSLKLSYNSRLSSSALTTIQRCRALKELDIAGCLQVRDAAVIAISKTASQLVSLNFSSCPRLTDGSVKTVLANCSKLQILDFSNLPLVSPSCLYFLLRTQSSETASGLHPNVTTKTSSSYGLQLKIVRFSVSPRMSFSTALSLKRARPDIKVMFLRPSNNRSKRGRASMSLRHRESMCSTAPTSSETSSRDGKEITHVLRAYRCSQTQNPCGAHVRKHRRGKYTQNTADQLYNMMR